MSTAIDPLKQDWSKIPIPQNYTDLHKYYGDPTDPDFEQDFVTTFSEKLSNGKVITVRCHIAMVQPLKRVWNSAGQYIHSYAGCYNFRNVRGSQTHLSLHSWGLAIDVNAETNELGKTPNQPIPLVTAFRAQKFFWGGDYHHRKDGMHFQMAGDF